MRDIFDQAWAAAQQTIGTELWEQLPDDVRVLAIHKQICRMDPEQMHGLPLVEDGSAGNDAWPTADHKTR